MKNGEKEKIHWGREGCWGKPETQHLSWEPTRHRAGRMPLAEGVTGKGAERGRRGQLVASVCGVCVRVARVCMCVCVACVLCVQRHVGSVCVSM